jgi:SAM-dependent methyltransferase
VRTGINPNPVGGDQRSDEETEAFIGAMHAIAQGMAETIADAIDLSRYTKMLDVGGGPGTYIQAFLQKAPGLRATLFDLPRVIDIARRRLIEPGIRDRVDFVEGDYEADELPVGYNLVLLSAIIHSNSRDGNRKLYEKIYASVIPGGDIIIRDHIMDATRTVPQDGAIFAVNMLVATEGGNSYTFDEVREDLEKAGFKDVRVIREGQRMDQLVSATK